MKSHEQIIKDFERAKELDFRALSLQKRKMEEAEGYYAGSDKYYVASVGDQGTRKAVVFNRIQPLIQSISGFMIQHRRDVEYVPYLQDDAERKEAYDNINTMREDMRSKANASDYEDRQNTDFLIGGVGFTDVDISFFHEADRDPNGEYLMVRVSPREMWWDGLAREANLLDSRRFYFNKKFELREALEIFKGSEPGDFEPAPQDGRSFQYDPRGGAINQVRYDTDPSDVSLVGVWYYQWWEREKYFRCDNPIYELSPQDATLLLQRMDIIADTQDVEDEDLQDLFTFDPKALNLVCTPTIKKGLEILFDQFGLDVEFVEGQKRCYYSAVLSGKKVFRAYKNIDQTGFTIKAKTGMWNEIDKYWYGMVEVMKQPQKYASKALTESIYVIASNSKGGVMYEKSAVKDPEKFERLWAASNAAIEVADGALSGGKIQPKNTGINPVNLSGYAEIYQISQAALTDVTGVNPEFLGNSDSKQLNAAVERQRIKQVTSALAPYFASISLYDKERARGEVAYMRELIRVSGMRLVKMVGEDGETRLKALTADMFNLNYDVTLSEVPDTPTQREESSAIMMEIWKQYPQAAPVAIQYLPIKQKDINKLLKLMQPDPAQQQAAAQEEMALKTALLQSQQAETERTMADTQLKQVQKAKYQAEAKKTFAEAQQKDLENDALVQMPPEHINVTI